MPLARRAENGEPAAYSPAAVGSITSSPLWVRATQGTQLPRRGRKKAGANSGDRTPATLRPGATTLDRVHLAILLQASGKANALRTMLRSETERSLRRSTRSLQPQSERLGVVKIRLLRGMMERPKGELPIV